MKHTVASGETRTATVPVAEDAAYDVTVTGPNGFEKTFRGVLHGRTAAPGTKPARAPSGKPAPATTGGSSATPMIAAVAAALVVLGAGAVVLLGRMRTARGPCVRPRSTWLLRGRTHDPGGGPGPPRRPRRGPPEGPVSWTGYGEERAVGVTDDVDVLRRAVARGDA
ncbi:LAETG motif-containing sortase-dependent surface protein [Streptomyces sp. NPDC086796]|uniref:LAETG motif-containing sortase-dependent surface protein n=1 Tax=unclassified Streptomyces TaxID=2593676 RepID=UPI003394A76B